MSQTKAPTIVKATPGTVFNSPLPGLNANHTINIVITGTVPLPNPQCRCIGLVRDHFIICTFLVNMATGEFTITIPGGLLWDDNLYIVTVWSDDTASPGGIFIDTRPPGI